jgi:hypothetical protein
MSAKITQAGVEEVKEGVDTREKGVHSTQVSTTDIAATMGGYRPLTHPPGPRSLRLRELMGSLNWTAADVGRLLLRSPNLVRKWTCGVREPPVHMIALLEYMADEIRRKSALK